MHLILEGGTPSRRKATPQKSPASTPLRVGARGRNARTDGMGTIAESSEIDSPAVRSQSQQLNPVTSPLAAGAEHMGQFCYRPYWVFQNKFTKKLNQE
jgi:hypothetical protein